MTRRIQKKYTAPKGRQAQAKKHRAKKSGNFFELSASPRKFVYSKTQGRSPDLQRPCPFQGQVLSFPHFTVDKTERSYGCGGSGATPEKNGLSLFPIKRADQGACPAFVLNFLLISYAETFSRGKSFSFFIITPALFPVKRLGEFYEKTC